MPNTLITIENALRDACLQLEKQQNNDSSQLDSEVLLAYVLKKNRTYLRTWPEKKLNSDELEQFHSLLARRMSGEPVAYITGVREFWSMPLHVNTHTLIPRPETEQLVEIALEKIPSDEEWQIADLGTGSGAIALAIAKERPRCNIIATDSSPSALSIAKQNARELNLHNIEFREGNWLEPLSQLQLDLIVSNPPYIHPDDPHLKQGDCQFEPSTALQSIPDGLTDIRAIANSSRQHIKNLGWLIMEHGFDQGERAKEIMTQMGYTQVSVAKDLAQHDRICLGQWMTEKA